MSRVVSLVGSSFVAVALQVALAAPAFAQDEPTVAPEPSEVAPGEPVPRPTGSHASAARVDDELMPASQ